MRTCLWATTTRVFLLVLVYLLLVVISLVCGLRTDAIRCAFVSAFVCSLRGLFACVLSWSFLLRLLQRQF